jgi:predicted Zn-ribbon and HTH transcriptional regulator
MEDYITDMDNDSFDKDEQEKTFLDKLVNEKLNPKVLDLEDEPPDPEPEIKQLTDEEDDIYDTLEKLKGYRKVRPQFPLDHLVLCEECRFEGVVGFRQRFCPECKSLLIRPEEVEGTATQRERIRP